MVGVNRMSWMRASFSWPLGPPPNLPNMVGVRAVLQAATTGGRKWSECQASVCDDEEYSDECRGSQQLHLRLRSFLLPCEGLRGCVFAELLQASGERFLSPTRRGGIRDGAPGHRGLSRESSPGPTGELDLNRRLLHAQSHSAVLLCCRARSSSGGN